MKSSQEALLKKNLQGDLMRYRSDIDGLRAVAVLFVLMFHGGLSLFPSGFIGVDIFFVISGFLITSIIISDLNNNKFFLSEFYVRRLWRIQPALLSVVAFTFILAALFYLPSDFIDYIKSAKYTTLLISNQYFARSTTGYAAPETDFLLLLHTWSLSIEWQWYLLLPACLYFLHRYLPKKAIFPVSLIILIASFILCYYLSSNFTNKSYYFLTSRIFEFMMGASLAALNTEKIKLSDYQASLLSLLSLSAIFYTARKSDIILGYPDYYALLVSISTTLLIFTGCKSNGLFTKVLSLRPFVFIGAISYSLYLWHWPIFATGRYLGYQNGIAFKIICYVITFALSYTSYIFIEKPLRRIKLSLFKSVLFLVLIPVLFFIALLPLSEKYNGFDFRFGNEFLRVRSILQEYASPYREDCLNGNTDGKEKKCLVGNVNAKKRALLIGDSHSNHFWGFFNVLAKDVNMSVALQGTSSCLTLPGIYQFDWWYFKNTIYKECHNNTSEYYKNIKRNHYDYVIIGEVWSNYDGDNIINRLGDKRSIALSRERITTAMKDALNMIIKSGATPVIIKSIAPMPPKYMSCFYQHFKLRSTFSPSLCSRKFFDNDEKEWFSQLFTEMRKEYPSLIIIDPKDIQCEGGSCKSDLDGIPVYRDVGHLTDYSSFKFGETYLRKFGNPFR